MEFIDDIIRYLTISETLRKGEERKEGEEREEDGEEESPQVPIPFSSEDLVPFVQRPALRGRTERH